MSFVAPSLHKTGGIPGRGNRAHKSTERVVSARQLQKKVVTHSFRGQGRVAGRGKTPGAAKWVAVFQMTNSFLMQGHSLGKGHFPCETLKLMSGSSTAYASILLALRWKLRGGALEEMIVAGGGGAGGKGYADITHSSEVPAVLHTQVLAPVKKKYQRRRPAVTLLSGTEQG